MVKELSPSKMLLCEQFQKIANEKTNKEKKKLIELYKTDKRFLQIIQYAYHDMIEFLLPDSKPPYIPAEGSKDDWYNSSLNGNILRKIMPIFVKGAGYDNLNQIKREAKFIDLLQSIYKEDAELLCEVINKKITGLSKKLAMETLPEVFSTNHLII